MMRIWLLIALMFTASGAYAETRIQEVAGLSGQKAWLVEDHSLSFVTMRIAVSGSGTAYDAKGKEGLASFAMQMFDEGAGEMNALALVQALQGRAIRLNADANEDTAEISIQTLSDFKGYAFDLLALALNKPRYDMDAVERVRAAMINEVRQAEENPSYTASLALKGLDFPGHPYRHAKLGTLESLAQLSPDDLRRYRETQLTCGEKTVSVVGDMTAAELKTLLDRLFPAPHCQATMAAVPDIAVPDAAEPLRVKKNVPQTVVMASLPGVMRSDPRYYALVVLNHILGGNTLTGRLGKEIRDKRGLAYYAESDIVSLEHAGYIAISFATRKEQAQAALEVFRGTLTALKEKGITPAELADAKRYITGSFALGLDGQNALAEYLVNVQRHKLGIDYLQHRNHLIDAVTLPQVQELVHSLLSHSPAIVMVGDL